MAASENKTVLYSLFGNTLSKILNNIQTSQLTRSANQLTGFYTTQASTKRCLQTNLNGTCQGMKKENY